MDFSNFFKDLLKYSEKNFDQGTKVTVRNLGEILELLDENGTYEGLPFMPEMEKFCGKCFTVHKSVKNIFIEGIGFRRIRNTVILDGVTCDGSAHGGCQRTCFILWKKAWLKKVNESSTRSLSDSNIDLKTSLEERKLRLCQLANLRVASRPPYSLEGLVQCFSDKELGSIDLLFFRLLTFSLWLKQVFLKKMGRSFSNVEMLHGSLKRTPAICLNLKPGEQVMVKTKEEIVRTLDSKGRNRGLAFIPEMLKYCGKRYRVLKRIEKIVDQKNGKIRTISNTVLLENVVCDGSFHRNCPLNCYILWREAWLKRADNSVRV